MLTQNAIEPAMSDWASPVAVAPKIDGSARFCVGYGKFNSGTIWDSCPIPLIDDFIDRL